MKRLSRNSTFTVPLNKSAHKWAQELCQGFDRSEKIGQIYLNGIAVYAVAYYLRCMGFEVDTDTSQINNPAIRAVMDVADLNVIGRGKIECRPVLPEMQVVTIPPELQQDRVGHVAVQLNIELNQAILLGFQKSVLNTNYLELEFLQSIDDLPDYLDSLESPITLTRREILSSWWDNLFDQGWQSLETLLNQSQPSFSFSFRNQGSIKTNSIERAKLIDLGIQLGHQSVVLLIAIAPQLDGQDIQQDITEFDLLVQLHPAHGEPYLPSGITLTLTTDDQQSLQAVRAREQDNYIQLKRFQATLNETFNIVIRYGEICITESFQV